ncbi:hypothetical protein K470DRAFT_240580 [Piedraia hortae CBS 480.64]|uniref:RRM domain-containing protein n=1 Tax=Piedraia hortae CBS 480.64 TaxID=1314780 RepID=A0A6A7C839_9PEZI|nr:hypothetical protein K470DRAFT_240580 [Piedraia hortae CBS 480.64]
MPQIKQEINRSGWETTDMPSVCERCLPDNPFVQMLKEDYGAECKLCTRPFTVFRWKADRTSRQKRTGICLTCARLKNACQCCMLDLSFGLSVAIRDAALKMVAPGPQSSINREYFAQNHERAIEEGRGLEGYEKTDEKARDLLRRLASTQPYHKKKREERLALEAAPGSAAPGPVRRVAPRKGGNAPRPEDILPPADVHITSLFVTGVDDDLPEHALRVHFSKYGTLRSVVCSHRSHCAFINYVDRPAAEAAAAACQGRAIVQGVPLKVQWGKPKPLDNMDQELRMANAKAGREAHDSVEMVEEARSSLLLEKGKEKAKAMPPPPGKDNVKYPSMMAGRS